MERMMKCIKALLATGILVISLTTCVNPFNWLAEVSDEVMVAKDMYLQVNEVTPAKNEPAFSPEDSLLVVFDRDVDPASVTAATVVFSPTAEFSSTFDPGTNTLSITPAALEGDTPYSVTLTSGLRGTDASVLRDQYVWNFTTTNSPTGTIYMKDISSGSQTYTNSTNIKLEISANGVVTGDLGMRISLTSFTKDDDVVTWQDLVPQIASYPMGGSVADDGPRSLYYQFRDAADHRTAVKSVTITQDMTAPSMVLNNPPTYIGTSGWTSDITVTEVGSGISTYAWSITTGGSLATISPTDQLNTTVTGTGAGSLRLRLAVTDGAGNIGNFYTSSAPYIIVDIIAPTAPSITSGPPNPLRGNPPTYIWASTDATGADYFRYRYDTDAGYSTETTDLTASPSAKYGARYFYVQERDAAGNWSTSDSWYAWIYPDWIEPRYALTVDRSPTVRWAEMPIIGGTKFDVFYRKSTTPIWTQLLNDTTTLAIELPPNTLDASSTYYWYYTVTLFSTTRIPYGGDWFWFKTNALP